MCWYDRILFQGAGWCLSTHCVLWHLRIPYCAGDGPGSWGEWRVAARFSVSSAGGQCAVRPRASHIGITLWHQDTQRGGQGPHEACPGHQWHSDIPQALRGLELSCSECQHNGCSQVKVTRYRGQESLPPLEFAIQHSYRKLENAESTPKTTGKAANCGNYIIYSPKLGLLLCDFEIYTGSVFVSLMFLYQNWDYVFTQLLGYCSCNSNSCSSWSYFKLNFWWDWF